MGSETTVDAEICRQSAGSMSVMAASDEPGARSQHRSERTRKTWTLRRGSSSQERAEVPRIGGVVTHLKSLNLFKRSQLESEQPELAREVTLLTCHG